MTSAIPPKRGDLFRYNIVDVHFLPEITEEEKEHKARELARTRDWWDRADLIQSLQPYILSRCDDVWLLYRKSIQETVCKEILKYCSILYHGQKLCLDVSDPVVQDAYWVNLFEPYFKPSCIATPDQTPCRMKYLVNKLEVMTNKDSQAGDLLYESGTFDEREYFGQFLLESVAKLYFLAQHELPRTKVCPNRRHFARRMRVYIDHRLGNDDSVDCCMFSHPDGEMGCFNDVFPEEDDLLSGIMYKWAHKWYANQFHNEPFATSLPDFITSMDWKVEDNDNE